jgi:SNF2 family DNA or RNA helicase
VTTLLTEYTLPRCVLLTGTPYQNTVLELFSLLHFVAPHIFHDVQLFKQRYGILSSLTDTRAPPALIAELQSLLRPFLLRRLKADVHLTLPKKTEVVLFADLTPLQTKFYKWILTKNIEALGSGNARGMLNTVMQLRKCCNHPYMFQGAEPEPFAEGDHIFENSGKFMLLHRLLHYLQARGHRVLCFSTSVQTLDILQDYLSYVGFSFERLDGSVRGEERFARVAKFNAVSSGSSKAGEASDPTFVFLLSTRAGGVGLNLTAADTVIFLDSDFNPQQDLQAAARVHRIGQTKPVTIIRLVAKNTIEEIILRRAQHKMRRTTEIVDSTLFATTSSASSSASAVDQTQDLSVREC